MLWIDKGYCLVKELVWNVRIKAFCYTKKDFMNNSLDLFNQTIKLEEWEKKLRQVPIIYLSFNLSTFQFIYLSIYLSFNLSIFQFIYLSIYLSFNLSIFLFIYISIDLSFNWSINSAQEKSVGWYLLKRRSKIFSLFFSIKHLRPVCCKKFGKYLNYIDFF